MRTNSKDVFRYLNIGLLTLLLGFSFSCKKENISPNTPSNPSGNSGPTNNSATASADLEFLPSQSNVHFQSYETGFLATSLGDTILTCVFGTTDEQGNDIDSLSIGFGISDSEGLSVGQTYPALSPIGMTAAHVKTEGANPVVVYNLVDIYPGEVVITSLTDTHIKGTFHFTGYAADTVDPTDPNKKKVIVKNGTFNCELLRM